MLLPSTHATALVLLLLASICLGCWANTFKFATGWRFELYALDFAIGAVLAATLAAWTLGTLGSELSFVDRMAVAGLRSQALAAGAGFVFGLGNMLLLAAVSLVGLSVAFPLVYSLAFPVWALTGVSNGRTPFLSSGVTALLAGFALAMMACWDPAVRRRPGNRSSPAPLRTSTKTAVAGVIGGIAIGLAYPLGQLAFWGDLGLGPYAGLLMFCVGLAVATALFSFFLNIALEGGHLSLTYIKAPRRRHLAGLSGGVIWTLGLLAWLLAQSGPVNEQPSYPLIWTAIASSVVLAAVWGAVAWGELRSVSSRSAALLGSAGVLFCAGLGLLAFRFNP